ncbi:MAG: outer membrane protein transport protein [Acidobacteria bacterium]|nr:outer membrane protein transport protein [Acidobacteriota bacterium]
MRKFGFAVMLFSALLIGSMVFAQVDEELFQGYQFNFFPPGARAMAMGGAFIGLADDATAAYSNPAGMVILSKPEISGEIKFMDYTTLRASESLVYYTGELTEFGESVFSPSFASFVYPMGNISVGVSMSNFINYKENVTWEARLVPGADWYFYGGTGSMEIQGYNFSASVAARLSDQFSIGATVNYVMFDMYTDTQLVNILGTPQNESIMDDSDSGIGFTVGILFSPNEMISIGAVYSYLPKVTLTQDLWSGTAETGVMQTPIDVPINLPDRFGAGIAFRPTDRLVILADVIMTQYSQITEHVTAKFNTFQDAWIARGEDVSDYIQTDDTTEIHAGIEYAVVTGETPVFVRGGVFTNPNHRPYYSGQWLEDAYYWNLTEYSTQISDTEVGITFGLGAVFGQIQIDGAYLISDSVNQGTVSVVIHLD